MKPYFSKFKKSYGVTFLQGNIVQAVLCDAAEPVGIWLVKPHALTQTDGAIAATFRLEHPDLKTWVSGIYYYCLQAFVVRLKPDELGFLIRHPEVMRYLEYKDRQRVKQQLRSGEGQEPWIKRAPRRKKVASEWRSIGKAVPA